MITKNNFVPEYHGISDYISFLNDHFVNSNEELVLFFDGEEQKIEHRFGSKQSVEIFETLQKRLKDGNFSLNYNDFVLNPKDTFIQIQNEIATFFPDFLLVVKEDFKKISQSLHNQYSVYVHIPDSVFDVEVQSSLNSLACPRSYDRMSNNFSLKINENEIIQFSKDHGSRTAKALMLYLVDDINKNGGEATLFVNFTISYTGICFFRKIEVSEGTTEEELSEQFSLDYQRVLCAIKHNRWFLNYFLSFGSNSNYYSYDYAPILAGIATRSFGGNSELVGGFRWMTFSCYDKFFEYIKKQICGGLIHYLKYNVLVTVPFRNSCWEVWGMVTGLESSEFSKHLTNNEIFFRECQAALAQYFSADEEEIFFKFLKNITGSVDVIPYDTECPVNYNVIDNIGSLE